MLNEDDQVISSYGSVYFLARNNATVAQSECRLKNSRDSGLCESGLKSGCLFVGITRTRLNDFIKVMQHIFRRGMFAWLVMIASVDWQSVGSVWMHLIDSNNLDEDVEMSRVGQLLTVFREEFDRASDH